VTERAHPSILTLLFTRLTDVARYVDIEDEPRTGYAWDASKRWAESRHKLSPALLEELATRAELCGSVYLGKILSPPGVSVRRTVCPLCGAAVTENNDSDLEDGLNYRYSLGTECDWCDSDSWPVPID
jgi:hypothetical protein